MVTLNYFPLETKCRWYDERSGKNMMGWVVIVPGDKNGLYTMSTKYKKPSWDRSDEKKYWKLVPASKLEIF